VFLPDKPPWGNNAKSRLFVQCCAGVVGASCCRVSQIERRCSLQVRQCLCPKRAVAAAAVAALLLVLLLLCAKGTSAMHLLLLLLLLFCAAAALHSETRCLASFLCCVWSCCCCCSDCQRDEDEVVHRARESHSSFFHFSRIFSLVAEILTSNPLNRVEFIEQWVSSNQSKQFAQRTVVRRAAPHFC